jgi:hypothetical protein
MLALAAVVAALGVASAPSAEGAPSWQPPVLIVGSHFGRAELFAWGDGGATVLWEELNSRLKNAPFGTTAFATSRGW